MSFVVAGLWFFAAWMMAFFGCCLLALSQDKHWRTVSGQEGPSRKPMTRTLGWLCIGLSLVLSIFRDGCSFAGLTWPLVLASGAFSVAMLLTYKAIWLKPLANLFLVEPSQVDHHTE
ncbi:MAG: DUF3325 domain-containing protein [Pseudomonadota bacterium]